MVAVILGITSCKQEENPKYHTPTTFTINEPALKNQAFQTANDMTDPATFNLFCSQPDYGFSAICNYSALVSLDPEAELDQWIELANTTPTNANMAIQTFELGVALNQLLNVENQEDFNDRNLGTTPQTCYFRAVCEIPGIEGSRIVSSNVVSYNKVLIQYAEKKPGWIYICGNIQNIETGENNKFTTPSIANLDAYNANWALYEPQDMIGQKLYVGTFNLVSKEDDFKEDMDNFNEGNVDACSQFRFFTQLLGWSRDASLGSNSEDFFVFPITDKWESGYSGEVIDQGLGNWGIFVPSGVKPVTIVVDVPNLKIFVKEGVHEVTFVGRDPEFK